MCTFNASKITFIHFLFASQIARSFCWRTTWTDVIFLDGLVFNKNLAIANRSRVSCAVRTQYVEDIYDNPVTLKSRLTVTQGHWKRNHWVDHTRLTIRRVIGCWILSWPWNVGHSRLLKLVPFESLGAVSYSPSTVTVAIFSVKEWRDLENKVRGRLRSLKMAPFDRPHATFYQSAIVNIALSCTIFEVFDIE